MWGTLAGECWGVDVVCVRGALVICRLRLCAWFPPNVARNSHVNLSNLELASLELQRLWVLLKVQAIELRATFRGSGLVLVARWVRGPGGPGGLGGLVTRWFPNSVMVPQQCRT